MDDLMFQDRRLPALLDRLMDTSEGPGRLHSDATWSVAVQEDRHRLGSSMREGCALVVKDLELLLNTRARPAGDAVYDFPFAAKSVINYGVRDMTGTSLTIDTPLTMEREVANAIRQFEPRVVTGTLRVKHAPGGSSSVHNLAYEIAAEVCPLPIPDALLMRTVMDMQNGLVKVMEQSHG
jgi:type VI secretion system protein ImpF